jgi:diaminopimelate epimerase
MDINFSKYQGTGNDFVIIDNRDNSFEIENNELIQKICNRRFGVGSDGLMLIEHSKIAGFRMRYFNADGSVSLCGNGSRCASAFAKRLGIIGNDANLETTDGIHHVYFEKDLVAFQLHDIGEFVQKEESYFIHNGSPHHINFCPDVSQIDVVVDGRAIRYSSEYSPKGTNVNFAEFTKEGIKVRTYERGVEDETLSCGTGVTAAAIAAALKQDMKSPISVETLGGKLVVSFKKIGTTFINIYLKGPAVHVFDGKISFQ